MHVIVDEGLPREVAAVLRILGDDAVSVQETPARGCSDVEMLQHLAREGSVLFTRNSAMWTVPHERAALRRLEVVMVVFPPEGDVLELVRLAVTHLAELRRLSATAGSRRFDLRRRGLTEVR